MTKNNANEDTTVEANETVVEETGKTYNELLKFVNPIAKPLAGKKLSKKLYKCIKKSTADKSIRRGVKEVQKALKKGEKGFVVFAGDTQPIEVMCHLPIVCEDNDVHYCYTPSKHSLGAALGSTKPTCCILVKEGSSNKKSFTECLSGIQELPHPQSC